MSVIMFMEIHRADVETFYLKNTNINLMLVLKAKTGDHQFHWDSSFWDHQPPKKYSSRKKRVLHQNVGIVPVEIQVIATQNISE